METLINMHLIFHWPQVLWLIWTLLALGVGIAKDGEKTDIKVSFIRTFILTIGNGLILYYGGFFVGCRP